MNASLWISLVSVIIAAISLVKSFFTDRKAKKLDLILKEKNVEETKLREENKKKADLEANIIETPSGKLNLLRIYNKGEHEATNVRMDISQQDENDEIQMNIEDDYFPYPKLLAQQNIDIPYLTFSNVTHHTVRLTWDDAFEINRSKEIVLDL